MSFFDAMFSVGVPMLSNHLQGQLAGDQLRYQRQGEEEDRRRKAEMDAIQMQLLQANLAKANAPTPTPWQAAGFGTKEDQLGYLGELERIRNPAQPVQLPWQEEGFADEGSYLGYLGRKERAENPADGRTPWAEAGFPDQESYLAYLERQGRAQYPERYDGAGGAQGGPERQQKFLTEYLLRTNQGRMDPESFKYLPPPPPEERLRTGQRAWEEIERYSDPEYNPYDDMPALPEEDPRDTSFTIEGLLRRSGLLKDEPIGPVASPQQGLLHTTVPAAPVPVPSAPPPPAADSMPRSSPAPGSGPSSTAFSPMQRAAASLLGTRIAELKAQGVSKEEGFQILQQEGYIDQNGDLITTAGEAPPW